MPRTPIKYPKTVGVRLTVEDGAKLHQLCDATQKPPGELLRLLIRCAQPTGLPPVEFVPPRLHQAHTADTVASGVDCGG